MSKMSEDDRRLAAQLSEVKTRLSAKEERLSKVVEQLKALNKTNTDLEKLKNLR